MDTNTQTSTPTQDKPTNNTAANIVQGIQNKASGISQQNTEQKKTDSQPQIDPNAGKEKYSVNGKEIWLTPEEAKRYVQKGIAFEPQVTQLHHLKNEVGEFVTKLKNDPMAILTDKRIGLTPEDVLKRIISSKTVSDQAKEFIGQWYYENVIEPMKLTPEQLKAREDAQYRQERERQDAAARDQMIKEENRRRAEEALSSIKASISEAMKESGLPTNDSPLGVMMARRIADVMRLGYFQRQTVTPKQAIEKVKIELKQMVSAWYDHLDDDQIVNEIGEKNAEKFKRYFLKLAKEADKKATISRNPSTKNGERMKTRDDVLEELEQIKRGK